MYLQMRTCNFHYGLVTFIGHHCGWLVGSENYFRVWTLMLEKILIESYYSTDRQGCCHWSCGVPAVHRLCAWSFSRWELCLPKCLMLFCSHHCSLSLLQVNARYVVRSKTCRASTVGRFCECRIKTVAKSERSTICANRLVKIVYMAIIMNYYVCHLITKHPVSSNYALPQKYLQTKKIAVSYFLSLLIEIWQMSYTKCSCLMPTVHVQ